MKRRGFIAAMLAVSVMLVGCAAPAPQAQGGGLKIVATIFAPYDFARALVKGTDAQLTMLIRPGVESHTFDPAPSDIVTIEDSDLFLCIGGHDEAWVDQVLSGGDRQGATVKLIDCVDGLPEAEDHDDHDDHDHEDHDHEAGIDEHIWTAPANARRMARAICDALIAVDAKQTEVYESNFRAFDAGITDLDAQFRQVVDGGARKEVVFGDRFPFRYFAEAYGLTWYSAFAGCASEGEPSAAAIAALIDRIKTDHIPVVYHIEQGSVRTAQTIAQEAGVETLLMHSCHNLTVEEFASGATYLSLMQNNVEALKQGLN